MRLIDADALKEVIYNNLYTITDFFNRQDRGMFWTAGIEKAIDAEPTIDAVEVVRCKDCKFNYANQIPSDDSCQLCVELPISEEFFCAYGEKDEEVEE